MMVTDVFCICYSPSAFCRLLSEWIYCPETALAPGQHCLGTWWILADSARIPLGSHQYRFRRMMSKLHNFCFILLMGGCMSIDRVSRKAMRTAPSRLKEDVASHTKNSCWIFMKLVLKVSCAYQEDTFLLKNLVPKHCIINHIFQLLVDRGCIYFCHDARI